MVSPADEQLAAPGGSEEEKRFPELSPALLYPDRDAASLGLSGRPSRVSLKEIPSPLLVVMFLNLDAPMAESVTDGARTLVQRFLPGGERTPGIKFLAIAAGSDVRDVAKFRKRNPSPYPLLADGGKRLYSKAGSPALPAVFLLERDKDGRRRIAWSGESLSPGEIEENIRKAVSAITGDGNPPSARQGKEVTRVNHTSRKPAEGKT